MTPKPKPKLGQNFLRDPQAQRAIVAALGDLSQCTIIEIGPGHGALTDHLAPHARHLIAVEFDPTLATELQHRFTAQPNVTILHADILTTDLCSLTPGKGPLDLIGNLPYYITSDILLTLFAASLRCPLRRAVLMIQREVAQRVAAPPGSRDFGLLSATAQLHASVTTLFTLPPSAFSPPPEVDSTVIRLEFHPRFAELGVARDPFLRFLRTAFAQKRKTLSNNLRVAGYSTESLTEAWPAHLPPMVRAEAIPLETMAVLFRALRPTTPDA